MIPKKYNGEQLVGKKCRPVTIIKNGAGACVTPDTICIIKDVVRGHGLTIQTERCPHCGMAAYITHVSREELTLIDESDPLQYAKELLKIRTEAAQNLICACAAVDEYCGKIGVPTYKDDTCTGLDFRIWCETDGAYSATLETIEKVLGAQSGIPGR